MLLHGIFTTASQGHCCDRGLKRLWFGHAGEPDIIEYPCARLESEKSRPVTG